MLVKSIVLVVAILAVVGEAVFNCQKINPHGRGFKCKKQYHDELFRNVSRTLMQLEGTIQYACLYRSNARLREVIETGRYKLTTQLHGYDEDDIHIKIKGPVLYLSARNSRFINTEVTILPRFVEVSKASYIYDGSTLDIVFPIKTATTCDRGLRYKVAKVPKFNNVWGRVPLADARMKVGKERNKTNNALSDEKVDAERDVTPPPDRPFTIVL